MLKNVRFTGFESSHTFCKDLVSNNFSASAPSFSDEVFVDCSDYFVFPGFADVHVHLRQPGFSYKETTASGSAAAAAGGFCAVCAMPNLDPVPDCADNLLPYRGRLSGGEAVDVYSFGSITKGEKGLELSDMEGLAPYVCGYSDDGRGVEDRGMMLEAMQRAKALGKVISAHCEDMREAKDSPEAEYRQLQRDIELALITGVKYHACHISTKESVELVRQAKKSGIDVTCETAPHYLLLCDENVRDDGRFRMNPPLRTKEDRDALLCGIADGTVDMTATDHAPHSAEEKSKGLKSLNGIVGLETAFPVLYTRLVKEMKIISLQRLLTLMSEAPSKRFGIEIRGRTVFDLGESYKIDPNKFLSKGRSTPFDGMTVFGRCIATVCDGRLAYFDGKAYARQEAKQEQIL